MKTETRPSDIRGTLYEQVDELGAEIKEANKHIAALHVLFAEYREAFGLADVDFSGEKPQERMLEYEEKFCALQCTNLGHDIGPDHCGKAEHDYCYRCGVSRAALEADDD